MTDLNLDGESHAHSLIAAGKVDKTSDWSFSAEDGNKLLGSDGNDWQSYSKFHLGLDREANEETKARYKYPYGKSGKVYRSGVVAVKQRAAQQGDSAIEAAAGKLLDQIDVDKSVKPGSVKVYPSIEAFRADARSAPEQQLHERLRASFDTEVKAGDEGSRELTFTISTQSADRYGDSIAIDGWKLDAYRKNPVVLWAHDSSSPPVAKATKVWTESGKLMAAAKFVGADMPVVGPMAECIHQMYLQGFLSATSVGFLPLKYAFADDPARRYGIDFLEQELLEFSCVPVPANAEALIEGKAAGIDVTPCLDWCVTQLRSAADSSRIINLAESVLGGSGADIVALAWAERIVAAQGKTIVARERIERIERAAKQERLRRARARDLDVIRARTL